MKTHDLYPCSEFKEFPYQVQAEQCLRRMQRGLDGRHLSAVASRDRPAVAAREQMEKPVLV